ncbi:N-acetylaspartyl-glutamate synthetase A [Camelus ferus]|nr:N-acetylaspartyl-glutamate synthetase A [Camelus ferus]
MAQEGPAGVGEGRPRAPPNQHNDYISRFDEASGLANVHGQVHPEVHVLCPGLLHWVLIHHREDPTPPKQCCSEQDVRFRAMLLDQIANTTVGGNLSLQLSQKALTAFLDVVLVRDICHLTCLDVSYLFLKESCGKDIRVVAVGGQVIGSMLCCSTDRWTQSNCSLGGLSVMCPLTEQGKQLAIQVSNITDTDFCGIDLLNMDDGSFVVCEANANIGFLAFDQACNLDMSGIIADYTVSLLPTRQTGRMAVLPGLSSPREKKEPDGCASAQGVAESVYAINSGSTSSEPEPELREPWDSSASTAGPRPPCCRTPATTFTTGLLPS